MASPLVMLAIETLFDIYCKSFFKTVHPTPVRVSKNHAVPFGIFKIKSIREVHKK